MNHDYDIRHYRCPRTRKEAGMHPRGEWDGKEDSGFVSIIGWGSLGAIVLWIFLVLVLA